MRSRHSRLLPGLILLAVALLAGPVFAAEAAGGESDLSIFGKRHGCSFDFGLTAGVGIAALSFFVTLLFGAAFAFESHSVRTENWTAEQFEPAPSPAGLSSFLFESLAMKLGGFLGALIGVAAGAQIKFSSWIFGQAAAGHIGRALFAGIAIGLVWTLLPLWRARPQRPLATVLC